MSARSEIAARRQREGLFALIVLAAACLMPLPLPDGSLAHIPDLCVFHRWTGLPCAGCGLIRSLVCMAHGCPALAIGYHPLGPAAFVALIVFCAGRLIAPGRSLPSRGANLAVLASIVALLGVWGLRLTGFLPPPHGPTRVVH